MFAWWKGKKKREIELFTASFEFHIYIFDKNEGNKNIGEDFL